MDKEQMWEILTEKGIATDAEINLVTCIIGYSEETMKSILYARTGFYDFEQILENS